MSFWVPSAFCFKICSGYYMRWYLLSKVFSLWYSDAILNGRQLFGLVNINFQNYHDFLYSKSYYKMCQHQSPGNWLLEFVKGIHQKMWKHTGICQIFSFLCLHWLKRFNFSSETVLFWLNICSVFSQLWTLFVLFVSVWESTNQEKGNLLFVFEGVVMRNPLNCSFLAKIRGTWKLSSFCHVIAMMALTTTFLLNS